MTRASSIIAAIGGTLLLLLGGYADAARAAKPSVFAAYQVRLEISRNGISLGAPESTVVTGESASLELGSAAHPGRVTMQQRVTGFPGADDSKALLELEFYRQGASRLHRIVAPTFGVDLGRAQHYELRTEQGVIRILARVDGLHEAPGASTPGIQTAPYMDL